MGLSQCWGLGGLCGRLREVVYSVVLGVLGVLGCYAGKYIRTGAGIQMKLGCLRAGARWHWEPG